MEVPEHLGKTDFGEAMLRAEVVSDGLLLEVEVAVAVVGISVPSSEVVEKTLAWLLADFLGEAKRLSGRMCSMLLFKSKQDK